jgi:hypothetical protein
MLQHCIAGSFSRLLGPDHPYPPGKRPEEEVDGRESGSVHARSRPSEIGNVGSPITCSAALRSDATSAPHASPRSLKSGAHRPRSPLSYDHDHRSISPSTPPVVLASDSRVIPENEHFDGVATTQPDMPLQLQPWHKTPSLNLFGLCTALPSPELQSGCWPGEMRSNRDRFYRS